MVGSIPNCFLPNSGSDGIHFHNFTSDFSGNYEDTLKKRVRKYNLRIILFSVEILKPMPVFFHYMHFPDILKTVPILLMIGFN